MRQARENAFITVCGVLILLLFGGCAGQAVRPQPDKQPQYPKQGYIRKPAIGVSIKSPDEPHLQVMAFTEGSLAEKSGITIGDIIRAVDGNQVNSYFQLRRILDTRLPGDSVLVTVDRNGQAVDCNVVLGHADVPRLWDSLESVIADEIEKRTIRVAVIAGEITNLRIINSSELEQYKTAAKTDLLSQYEEFLLRYFGKNERLFILDRNKVEEILNEFELGESGLIPEEVRAKLGKMLGVTHLLIPSHVVWREGTTSYVKLVDIESGRVLLSSILPMDK